MDDTSVLFWTPQDMPDDVLEWDPDVEPTRFADGFGHNALEICVRLRRLGVSARVGRDVARNDRVVVFLPLLLDRRDQLRLVRDLSRHRAVALFAIRSDFLISYSLPVRPSVELVPNRASLVAPHQRWLPPLPQRGLLPRDPARGTSMETLSYKGYGENLPGAARRGDWADRLSELGVRWDADVRHPSTGHNRWHDFRSSDASLCLRGEPGQLGLLRKPATKLINSWCAGSVPLVGREPGYLELVKHREDAMVVDSPEEVLDTLRELRADPALVSRLQAGGAFRAQQFRREVVLQAWRDLLTGPVEPARVLTSSSAASVVRVTARYAFDAARGDRRSPLWRGVGE